MAITIPNKNNIRPTGKPKCKPSAAKLAMVNPGPVFISKTGASSSGIPLVEPRGGVASPNTREGYYGYNIRPDVPGGWQDDESYSVVVGEIVDGFAGVLSGQDVFVDPTAIPDPITTFSGLTHTVPAGGRGERIGVGVTTTKIYFIDN